MTNHPDLDTLSAALDGEPESPHMQRCALCRGRLAELRLARAAVAEPVVPVPDDVRDRAIAGALAAATADTAPPEEAPIVELRARRKWWLGGSAAAAVVAVVMGAAALVGGVGGSNNDTPTASSGDTAAEHAVGPGPQAFDAGDLGDVATIDALRAKVSVGRAAAPPAPSAAPAAGGALSATADAPTDSAVAAPRQVGTRVCEIEARTARPLLGFVVYAANLRYQGTPAVALGFAVTPESPPETLLVLTPPPECRVLAETSLP